MSWITKRPKLATALAVCFATLSFVVAPLRAATWFSLGPFGGSARSFAVDPRNPQHLYLGSASGWLFESADGGKSWKRLSKVGKRDDLVLDNIIVDHADSRHLIVAAYTVDRPDGGLFESRDGGVNWYSQAEMRGQSVRALTAAPSDPRIMAAGTLQGVYLTRDSGVHWNLISPAGSTEIHEIESLAIDPKDPSIIFAGTWHLPWKTTDGGAHWTNIGVKQGLIDDSDVFSIIIDPTQPQTVYASACSGIYKSIDAGSNFRKIQGIPKEARRTRKLAQDPSHLETVFAGTTEGLYRTQTAGTNWSRLTGPDVIVNDVYVDPTNSAHVLIATDRAGVLASEDGGVTFAPSNRGFSARQVTSFAYDPRRPASVYVGVVNDKESGGVFASIDGGVTWQQQSGGLGGRDVFSLASLADGTLLAGTSHGVYRFDSGLWSLSSDLAAVPVPPAPATGPKPAAKAGTSAAATTATATPAATNKLTSSAFTAAAGGQATPHKAPTPRRAPARPTSKAHRAPVLFYLPGRPQHPAPARRAITGRASTNRATTHRAAPLRPSSTRAASTRATTAQRRKPPTRALAAPTPPSAAAPAHATPQPSTLDAVVWSLATTDDVVWAGTSQGLMRGTDAAHLWTPVTGLQMPETRYVAANKDTIVVGNLRRLALSVDGGKRWDSLPLPQELTQVASIAVDEKGNLWCGGPEGVFYSTDYGLSWKTLRNLYLTFVSSVYFDPVGHRILVTSTNGTIVFAAHLPDYTVSYWDSGWNLHFVRPAGDHLLGVTKFDGTVVQPLMVESKMQDNKAQDPK